MASVCTQGEYLVGNIDINLTPDIVLRGRVGGGGGLHTARPLRRGVRCEVDRNSKCGVGGVGGRHLM